MRAIVGEMTGGAREQILVGLARKQVPVILHRLAEMGQQTVATGIGANPHAPLKLDNI